MCYKYKFILYYYMASPSSRYKALSDWLIERAFLSFYAHRPITDYANANMLC